MIKQEAIRTVLLNSLYLKPTESCLVVTDTIKEPIGKAFYEYARNLSRKADIIVIEPTREHAAEPPQDTAAQMLLYDVQLLITEKSLTHTRARRDASQRGARIATMPGITEAMANRCLDIDYQSLRENSNRLYALLKQTRRIRVTTMLGTDMAFDVGSNEFFGKDGGTFNVPGAYGNLPEGEVSFSPASCHGRYVVDASFPDLGVLDSPLSFWVKNGLVNKVSGFQADSVIRRLNAAGPAAFGVAELGIGLNPKAIITGNILEDEKVIGTVHIAVGNNLSYGGSNDVPLHLDGVITKPDIYADKEIIMRQGVFQW